MTADHLEETVNIDLNRIQRDRLERWVRVCLDAGQIEEAERIRNKITKHDLREVA